MPAKNSFDRRQIGLAHLDDDAEFLGKQRRERIVSQIGEVAVDAAAPGKGHFAQRHRKPAVGAIVVGEQQILGEHLLHTDEAAP